MKTPLSPDDARAFAGALLDWFSAAARPLPWRASYDPYGVWISEIMLQQTQMERGVRYYLSWMRRFPDIGAVARADEREILAAWEGLGYYSRARNLHRAAKTVMADFGGVFPDSLEAIRSLPGVGDYTAGAIASIAFNLPVPAVDANVLRVFARLLDSDAPAGDREFRAMVTEAVRGLIPAGSARRFNQGLMELGALVCGKVPRCPICPLAALCLARQRGTADQRPRRADKGGIARLETTAGIIAVDGGVLIRKRPATGLWPGLWEFPGGGVRPGETPKQALGRHLEAAGLRLSVGEKLGVVKHGYTSNRVTLHGFVCAPADGDASPPAPGAGDEAGRWVTRDEIGGYAFPAGHRKLLEILGWK